MLAHAKQIAPRRRDSGVLTIVTGNTARAPKAPQEKADARTEAALLFRAGIDGAGLGVSGAAERLGVSASRVAAKVDPGNVTAVPTLADVVALRDAGGRGLEAARRVVAALAESVESAGAEHPASPAALPVLAAEMMASVADASRLAVTAGDADDMRAALAKIEALCARMRASV